MYIFFPQGPLTTDFFHLHFISNICNALLQQPLQMGNAIPIVLQVINVNIVHYHNPNGLYAGKSTSKGMYSLTVFEKTGTLATE